MKKLIFFTIALFTVVLFSQCSQKGKVNIAETYIEEGKFEEAEKRLQLAYEDEKASVWPKTYIVAAKLSAAKYKEEKDIQLLQDAFDHYMKAIELDKENGGRFENEIKVALTFFQNELTNAGIESFQEQNFEIAMKAFEDVLKINKLDMFQEDSGEEVVDTAIIYNTGLAAYNSENWETAAKYLEKSIEYNYGEGDAVLLLHQVYGTMQDSSKMVQNLKTGFEKYPEDDRLLTQLINFYLETRQNAEAMEYLNQAVEANPENATYYYARGVLHDQNQEYDEAIDDYKKAIELDESYFDALFNLGVIYYNRAINQMNIANDETDHQKFQEEKAKADELFKTALPYMERAYQEKPGEESVLESLRGLYYRFDMNEKYEEVDKKLKSIRGGTSSSPGEMDAIEE